MDRTRLWKVGTLVLTGTLLLAATPAAAAAPERMVGKQWSSPSLFDALVTWVTPWLDGARRAAEVSHGEVAEEGKDSGVASRSGSGSAAENEPTPRPQLGGEADPDG